MTKLQKVLQFGYLPRTFTSFRVRKHVLFTTTLHKTSLLPISRLFLHQMREQWDSRVDILHCNVVRQQVQISGGIFADEEGTRLCHKDEWACRRWSATMILLSLSSTWAIPVELERWVWPLTLSPPLQAPIQELKAFPSYQSPERSSKPTVMNVDLSNFWRSLRDTLSYIPLLLPIIILVFYLYQSFPTATANTRGFSRLLCLWDEILME